MAPASSGGTVAVQDRCHFQDEDLLGGPQPFSGTLQSITIVGLVGKAESGDGMQKWGRDSFAVVGAGGILKTCSDARAATCAAVCAQLRDEGSTGSLEVWFKASRHAWSGSWSFRVLWALKHAASSSEGEGVASASAGVGHGGGLAQQEEDDGGGDLSGCPATVEDLQTATPDGTIEGESSADAVPSGPGLAELLLAAGGDGGDLLEAASPTTWSRRFRAPPPWFFLSVCTLKITG